MKRILVLMVMLAIVMEQQINRHSQNQFLKSNQPKNHSLKTRRLKKKYDQKTETINGNNEYYIYLSRDGRTYSTKKEKGFKFDRYPDGRNLYMDDKQNNAENCRIYPYASDYYESVLTDTSKSSLDNLSNRRNNADSVQNIDTHTTGTFCQESVTIKALLAYDTVKCQPVMPKDRFDYCWDENDNAYEWDEKMGGNIIQYGTDGWIYFRMMYVIRYDMRTDQCLLFSNKRLNDHKGKLQDDDKLIAAFYYPPRVIGSTWSYTPYQQCVYSITVMFSQLNKNGYDSIRPKGFKTTSYFPSAFLRLYFIPGSQLYCYTSNNIPNRVRKTKEEKDAELDINNKDKEYRELIRIEKDQIQKEQVDGMCYITQDSQLYKFPDEIAEEERKKREKEDNEKKEKEEKEAIQRAKVTGDIGCAELEDRRRLKKHKHIKKIRNRLNRLKKITARDTRLKKVRRSHSHIKS